MSILHRSVAVLLVAAGSALLTRAQVQWTGGESVVVGPSENLTVDAAQPDIFCLTNNGALAFVAGGSVTITGNVVSAVGADTGTGLLTIASGGTLFSTSPFGFTVGFLGGEGTLTVEAGGVFDLGAGPLSVCANAQGMFLDTETRGTVNVAGYVRAGDLEFTSWFPNDPGTADGLAEEVRGEVNFFTGGFMDVEKILKHDSAISTLLFDGGTLRLRANDSLISLDSRAELRFSAAAGSYVALDIPSVHAWFSEELGGHLAFTGPGGVKKLGNGRLSFFGHQMDYQGDTVIEAGTICLERPNLMPHGVGFGNIVINPGAFLDLNGRDVILNNILGPGVLMNQDMACPTLSLPADGSDTLWTRGIRGGPVVLNKIGNGTMTLSGHNLLPDGLRVSEGAVSIVPAEGYLFYRFKVEDMKNPNCGMMQICELRLYDGEVNVTPFRTNVFWDSTYSDDWLSNNHTCPGNEEPPNAVNGNKPEPPSPIDVDGNGNKWLDFRLAPGRSNEDRARVWVRLDFPGAQKVTSYNWATSNDAPERDPTAWRLQGSNDGDTWVDLHVASGEQVTDWRFQWVSEEGFPVDTTNMSGQTIGADARVYVNGGATLILDGVTETIGGLEGYGAVTLDNASDLIVNAGDAASYVFAGDISGNGKVIKKGPGTQGFYGVNTFTGDFIVQEGTAEIEVMPTSTFGWFRFTVKDIRTYAEAVMQYSEFALYDSGGTRMNLGLTEGAGVSALNPGEFATPASYPTGDNEIVANLFDNQTGTKWCPNQNLVKPDNPSTWRTIVMRLAPGSPEIAAYNLATANDSPERDPIAWTLEGSPDGTHWWTLDDKAGYIPTTNRFTWYNEGVPFAFRNPATLSEGAGALALSAGSVVEVQAGATLAVTGGAAPISALRVDMAAGAGTITRFTPAPNGTLHLTHASGNPTSWAIPLTLGTLDDSAGNLRTWQVYADGVLLRGYTLALDTATGMLKLIPQGTMIILK